MLSAVGLNERRLPVDAHTLDQLKRWADDDLRSLNGQIEYLLKRGLKDAGRWKDPPLPEK